MNRKELQVYIMLFVMTIVFPFAVEAQSDKNLVRQGNKDFSNGAYNEAEINYRKALDKNPMNTTAQFNLGDAMYQQEDYEKAAEVFSKTELKGKSSTEKSNVYYNYGNSMLKAGKAEEATAAYKQALRENPRNEEARYNLEYLRQKQQDQNQDQNKDDKKDQDKQDQDKQDQENKDQQDQNKDEQEQNKDQEQNQDQQEQNQQDQKQEQGEQNEQQAQKISKKDAERMLEALKNNEKKTLENLKKAKKQNAKVIKSEKDW